MDPTANSTNTGAAQNAQTGSGGEQGGDGTAPSNINMRVFQSVSALADYLIALVEKLDKQEEDDKLDVNQTLGYIDRNHEAYKDKMGKDAWEANVCVPLAQIVKKLYEADICQCEKCVKRRKEVSEMFEAADNPGAKN
jgi:hypothetical protein